MEDAQFLPSSAGTFLGPDGGLEIEVEDDAVLAGVVIATVVDGEATGLYAARVEPTGVDIEVVRGFGETAGNLATGFTLPAGSYHVYLVTDGSPVRANLRPSDFVGARDLEPAIPVDQTLQSLTEAIGGPLTNVYAAGDEATLSRSGLAFRAVYVTGEPYVGSLLGTCVYEGAPSNGYLPHCPGGPLFEEPVFASDFPHVSPTTGRSGAALTSFTATLPAGEYGQGVWYESVSQIDDAQGVGHWLSFIDG